MQKKVHSYRARVQQAVAAILAPFLDALIPLRERAKRTKKRTIADFSLAPSTHTLYGVEITTLLNYRDPHVSDLIRALKYEHSGHAADITAEIVADYLQEEIVSLRAFSPRPILILPIPLHASRVRERGFNQIEKILHRLPAEFGNGVLATVLTSALTRSRATPQQTKLSRQERLENVRGAFVVRDPAQIAHAHCIIVDDVTTTGATLAECVRTLKASGAQVTAIALARA